MKRVLRLGFIVGTSAIYLIWDESILAAPVVAASAWLGMWLAFASFSLLYGVAGFVLTQLLVRSYRRRLGTDKSRLQCWVAAKSDSRFRRWARGLLLNSGSIGFCMSSFALGPLATTWLAVSSGKVRGESTRVAAASSAIFAVTFVTPYCGLGRLIASLWA